MYCIGMWIYAYTKDSSTVYKYVIRMAVFSSTLATVLTSGFAKTPRVNSLYISAYSSATFDSSVLWTHGYQLLSLLHFIAKEERVTISTWVFLSVGKLSLFCWTLNWSLKYIRLWRNVQHNLKSHCLRITNESLRRFRCVVVAVKDPELRNYSVVLVCRCTRIMSWLCLLREHS